MMQLMLLLASGKPKAPKTPDLVKPIEHGLAQSFIHLWPLWLFLGAIVAAKFVWRGYQIHRLSKSGIAEIDQMSGHRFEEFLAIFFRRLGYHVEMTTRHGDYGADLVVTKERTRTAVQAKRWNKKVGVKAVQEAVASKAMYGCDAALVVASREFTQQAQRLARANNVDLWGRAILVDKLLAVRGTEAPVVRPVLEPAPPTTNTPRTAASATATTTPIAPAVLPNPLTGGADDPPVAAAAAATCVTCGVTVGEKVRAYCEQHSERFGGLTYCYHHQRGVRAAPATD